MKRSCSILRLTSLQTDRKLPRGAPRSLMNLSQFLGHHPSSSSSSSSMLCTSILLSPTTTLPTILLKSVNSHHIFSQSKMEKHPQDTLEYDQQRESYCKEACEIKPTKRVSDYILPHILNLYASRATPQDFEIYAPDATFEDPLMCAHGVQQIKSSFYSLAKVFSESRIVDYSIKENIISPGKTEILIDNKQYYKFLGKDRDMISLIKLYTEDGKIVRHEDWWDKKPLWNRETVKVPLIGRITEATRRASMFATHALMRFGKDPSM